MQSDKRPRTEVTVEEFRTAVAGFSHATTDTQMHQIEEVLQGFTRSQSSVPTILSILAEPLPFASKQTVALLLKRAITKNYMKFQPDAQKQVKAALVTLVAAPDSHPNIRFRIAECIGTICLCENLKLAAYPELCQFLEASLNPANPQAFSAALAVLSSLAETSPETMSVAEVNQIVAKIEPIFFSAITEAAVPVYVLATKCLFSFLHVMTADNVEDSAAIERYLESLFKVLSALLADPNLAKTREADLERLLIDIFEDLQEVVELHIDLFSEKSGRLLIDFVLSPVCLGSPRFDNSIRSSFLDFLGLLFSEYRELFNPKKAKHGYLERIFTLFTQILEQEEVAFQKLLAEDFAAAFEAVIDEGIQSIVYASIETITLEFKTKTVYDMVEKVITYFVGKGHPRVVLKLLSSSVQGLSSFYSKKLTNILTVFIFPGLKSTQFDLLVAAVRTVCFFAEYLASDFLEHYKEILPILLGLLDAGKASLATASDEAHKKATALIVENVLFATDLLVENLEESEIKDYSVEIMRKVVEVYALEHLNAETKKTAIETLGSVFSTAPNAVIREHMASLLQVLTAAASNEYLMGEAFIAVGKLLYYGLDKQADKNAVFQTHFKPYFDKSLSIVTATTQTHDFETYEGAFTVLYHTVMLFGRESSQFLSHDLIKRVMSFVEDAPDEVKEPDSEKDSADEEDDEDSPKARSRLPYAYMICSGIRFLGEALRHAADVLVPSAEFKEQVAHFLTYRLISENEDVRHQTFLAAKNFAVGSFLYLRDPSPATFMGIVEASFKNETSETNLVRNFEVLEDYLTDMLAAPGGVSVVQDSAFLASLGKTITEFLASQFEDSNIDTDLYVVIWEVVLTYIKGVSEASAAHFLDLVMGPMTFPLRSRDDYDICVFEELYGFLAEIIQAKPTLLGHLLKTQNADGSFQQLLLTSDSFGDEAVIRNAMFLLGVILEHPTEAFWMDQASLAAVVGHVQGCYQMCQLDVVKDNCVASMVKLFLNPKYASCLPPVLDEASMSAAVISRMPLKGDLQESSAMLKAIFALSGRGEANLGRFLGSKETQQFILNCVADSDGHEVSGETLALAKQWVRQYSGQMQEAFATLSEEAKAKVNAAMSG